MAKRRRSPVTKLLGSHSPSARRPGAARRRRAVWLAAVLVAGGTTALAQAPSALAALTFAYDAGSVTVTESAPFRSARFR